jgi:folate-binding protein YgfZ
MVTCGVKGLPAGGAAPGLFLTQKGKVVGHFHLAVLPDRIELIAPPAARGGLRDGLARYVIADDVALEDRAGAAALLSLIGPRVEAAAARLLGGPLPAADAAEGSIAGGRVLLVRRTRAGLPAVDLVADAAAAPPVREAALAAARAEGGGPLDGDALEVLRVEAGEPALGAEATVDTLPQECGLDASVSYAKGCFLGQEPVARLHARGHTNRGLAGLLLGPGAPLPERGAVVLAGEREAGAVTSAALSATLGRPIALALLRHEDAEPGTRLLLRTAGDPVACEAAALPFVR